MANFDSSHRLLLQVSKEVTGITMLVVALIGCSVPTHTTLNQYTGRIQILPQDEKWEEKLGQESYTRIALSHGIPRDSPEEVTVQRVANELLAAATDTEFVNQVNRYEWQIRVIVDDSESLILALPSGKLLMTTSVLAMTQNDIDLAAAIGHAIGHVLLRHGGERVTQKILPLPLFMADLKNEVPSTLQLIQLAEADYVGMILAAKAGYHPKDILQAWARMETRRLNDKSASNVYVDSRLKQLERRMEQLQVPLNGQQIFDR